MARGNIAIPEEKQINPLTGGGPVCSYFPIVDKSEAPTFKRKALFNKVFRAMEELRVFESQRCKKMREQRHRQKQIERKTRLNPHSHQFCVQKEIGDMAFRTLRQYWYGCGFVNVNRVFPIDTSGYVEQNQPTTNAW